MRAGANSNRLLVADTATASLPVREGSGREEKVALASGKAPQRLATERWGGQATKLFSEGWLSVPTKFLRSYAVLKPPLSPGEALFVLQLMTFKWDEAEPFPSYGRVAKAMGVTDKMARRYAQSLQKKGYLTRKYQKRAPNRFDLTRLFDAFAQERIGTVSEGNG
jgi:hypothetical protein